MTYQIWVLTPGERAQYISPRRPVLEIDIGVQLAANRIETPSVIKTLGLVLDKDLHRVRIPRGGAVAFGWTDESSRRELISNLAQQIGEDYCTFGIANQEDDDTMAVIGFDFHLPGQSRMKVVAVMRDSTAPIKSPWQRYVGGGKSSVAFIDVFDPGLDYHESRHDL